MSQNLKLMTDWQRSIGLLFRGLGRLAHVQMPDDAKRFYASDELRRAMAAYRAGRHEESEGLQSVYREIGKLHPREAVKLLRKLKHPYGRRGRPRGSGPFVSDDDRKLKTYGERVAAGEPHRLVEAELCMEAETYGCPNAGKDRLQRKIRKQERALRNKLAN